MTTTERIGLYGGTFDPIHQGHCHLISELVTREIVDRLLLIPAGQPWMREADPLASMGDRLAMVKLALAHLPAHIADRVSVNETELHRSGNSYTIDTVLEVQRDHPDAQLVLIVGSDVFTNIDKWHRSDELLKLVEVFVVARDGAGFDINALQISASAVRRKIAADQDVSEDLPESVWSYIKERKLYASQ